MEKDRLDLPMKSTGELHCKLQMISSIAEYNSEKLSWIDFLNRPTVRAGLFTDPRSIEQNVSFDRGDILMLCKVVMGDVVTGDRLVALVPLVLRKSHTTLKFGLVTICRLFVRSARIADFEFPREQGICPFQVFAAVVDTCTTQKSQIDLISVDSAPMRADDLQTYNLRMVDIQATYTIELTGGFDAYLQTLSARSRQKIKRTVRRFESSADAPVRIVAFRSPGEMNKLHVELTRVWGKSWHARVGNQQIPPATTLLALASHGWVRAYVLFVGEQSVASVLGFQYRNTFYYESPAYDQDWQDRSPGIVLLYHTVKNLFETDPPLRFDFGAGYGQYKQVFGTCQEYRGSIQVGVTRRGKLITYLQLYLGILFKSSRAAFSWTGIPRLIKRRIREKG